MKFSIRELLLVTVIVASTSGCKVETGEDVHFYPPGPEYQRTQDEAEARAEDVPDSSAPAPSPPKN